MRSYEQFYIGGQWTDTKGRGQIQVENPATEEILASVPEGNAQDVDAAVGAARQAFGPWSSVPVAERIESLARIREALARRADEMAEIITAELGAPAEWARGVHVGFPLAVIESFEEVAKNYEWETQVDGNDIVREPIGVVACITPWNFPLHQTVLKLAPAFAAGCTVVLKPSELTPLCHFLLAEIIDEAKLPAGVFNMVCGYAEEVGHPLVAHPDVDMVSFTGSNAGGRAVAATAAGTSKRVSLGLGGKSACVVLEDADLDKAILQGVKYGMMNTGQACSSLSRLVVPRKLLEEVERRVKRIVEEMTVGDPRPPEQGGDGTLPAPDSDAVTGQTRMGPLASERQRDQVLGYIRKGIDEGAVLLTGGVDPPEGLDKGYYVRPTVFSRVSTEMTVAQEEIFGPVLSILPYDTEDEAVRIANDSAYGLWGAVWAGQTERARDLAKRIRTGSISINGAAFSLTAPFGGYKQSGYGREFGRFGLEEFLQLKALLA